MSVEICAEGQAGRISNRTGVHLACRMYELDPSHSATQHRTGRSDSKRDRDSCLADAIFPAKPNLEDLRAFHFKFQFSSVPFRIGPNQFSPTQFSQVEGDICKRSNPVRTKIMVQIETYGEGHARHAARS